MCFKKKLKDASQGDMIDLKKLDLHSINEEDKTIAEAVAIAIQFAIKKRLPGFILSYKDSRSVSTIRVLHASKAKITTQHPQYVRKIHNTDFCIVKSSTAA